ncbi:MAG: hypothetical protein ACMXYA_03080, partial [Candidatus Woesearchaeota archaeon]
MGIFTRFFQKKEETEVATVRLSKLRKWVILQCKPQIRPILTQVQTNAQALTDYQKELQTKIDIFSQEGFHEPKDHLKKQITDYKQKWIQVCEELDSILQEKKEFETLDEYQDFYNNIREIITKIEQKQHQVEHVLFKYFHSKYSQTIHVIEKIKQNQRQFVDITDVDIVKKQRALLEQIALYFEKKEKTKKFEEEKQKLNKILDEQHIILHKIHTKIAHIKEDPKYAIELERKKRGEAPFQPLFYELELKDLQGREEVQQKKIALVEHQLERNEQEIAKLELDKHIQRIRTYIHTYIGIEVEILV